MDYKDCPLCLKWDCDCEDVLSKEEFERLVKEYEQWYKKRINPVKS